MKAPSSELLFYVAMLLGGAAYIALRLPTTAAEYQAVAVVLAVCVAAEAVLLLVRFRWSPEVFVAIALFLLGWGVVRGVADGFTGTRLGLTVGAVAALFAYPVLRREVRVPATANADLSGAADPARDVERDPASESGGM
jgi:hypothetical protein